MEWIKVTEQLLKRTKKTMIIFMRGGNFYGKIWSKFRVMQLGSQFGAVPW